MTKMKNRRITNSCTSLKKVNSKKTLFIWRQDERGRIGSGVMAVATKQAALEFIAWVSLLTMTIVRNNFKVTTEMTTARIHLLLTTRDSDQQLNLRKNFFLLQMWTTAFSKPVSHSLSKDCKHMTFRAQSFSSKRFHSTSRSKWVLESQVRVRFKWSQCGIWRARF